MHLVGNAGEWGYSVCASRRFNLGGKIICGLSCMLQEVMEEVGTTKSEPDTCDDDPNLAGAGVQQSNILLLS